MGEIAVKNKLYETDRLVPCGIFRYLAAGGPIIRWAVRPAGSACGRRVRNVRRSVGEFDTLDVSNERRTQAANGGVLRNGVFNAL
ncbi:hypothetical protein FACS1894189_0960 [Planctomycetales bacterium]|nr:hypothetical protein FACS1894189_0960 [Planctomycetales bacterium]